MRVLLLFVIGLFAFTVFADPERPLRPRALPLIGVCCLLAGALMMRRFV